VWSSVRHVRAVIRQNLGVSKSGVRRVLSAEQADIIRAHFKLWAPFTWEGRAMSKNSKRFLAMAMATLSRSRPTSDWRSRS